MFDRVRFDHGDDGKLTTGNTWVVMLSPECESNGKCEALRLFAIAPFTLRSEVSAFGDKLGFKALLFCARRTWTRSQKLGEVQHFVPR